MKNQPPSNRVRVLQLAATAFADPRTVKRWLRGEAVRPLVAHRLEVASRQLDAQAAQPALTP